MTDCKYALLLIICASGLTTVMGWSLKIRSRAANTFITIVVVHCHAIESGSFDTNKQSLGIPFMLNLFNSYDVRISLELHVLSIVGDSTTVGRTTLKDVYCATNSTD